LRVVQTWNLTEIQMPDGKRDPVVLHSDPEARAVLIELKPGESLGDHQVKEHAWLCVVSGSVRVGAAGESVDAEPGTLFRFMPDERHSVASKEGARLLLLLAPWPGEGHYRGSAA
jgi:quercetin dioxygenase-like cupin family protein